MIRAFLAAAVLAAAARAQSVAFPGPGFGSAGATSTPFTFTIPATSSSATTGQTNTAFKGSQSFVLNDLLAGATSAHVTGVGVRLFRTNTAWTSLTAATDTVLVELWSDNGSNLPGTLIAATTTSMLASTLPTAAAVNTFSFPSTLLSGTASSKFWVVVSLGGRTAANGTDYISWSQQGTNQSASGGYSSFTLSTGLWGLESTTIDKYLVVTGVTP
jgi:hypothetical protein